METKIYDEATFVVGSISLGYLVEKIEKMISVEAAGSNMVAWDKESLEKAITGGDAILTLSGDDVIGFVCLVPYSRYVEICALIVTPSYRKKGIGISLVRKAIDLAKKKYADKGIILFSNKISFHMGERLGFQSVEKDSLRDDKVWEICALCAECDKFPACHCRPMVLMS